MSNLKAEMANFRSRRDNQEQPREGKLAEWPRCAAHGCKLNSSYKVNGAALCTYHGGQEVNNWTAITDAIEEHKGLINKFNNMTHAGSYYWSDPATMRAMKGWHVLPMQEGETATSYLTRFGKFVEKTIYQTASEKMGG